jgi:predicted RNase H-like HicB family nuclease
MRYAMDFVVIIEPGETSYGAYVPDLPGCVAVGESHDETLRLIREAIELHLDTLRRDGRETPSPTSKVEIVHVDT